MQDIRIYRAYSTGADGTANVNGVYVSADLARNNGMNVVTDPSTSRKCVRTQLFIAPAQS